MKKRRKRNHNSWPSKTSGNLNKEVLQVNTYGLECFKPIYFSIEINTQGSAFSKSKNVGILLLLF